MDLQSFFSRPAVEVAAEMLNSYLTHETQQGTVSVRITEVEAYMADIDPGSHAFKGRTLRNQAMYGQPGTLYVYFTYGMHHCVNIVCSPVDEASGVLIRAGEIVKGHHLAALRRSKAKSSRDYARGPARLAQALGYTLAHNGTKASWSPAVEKPDIMSGPRVGVAGLGGTEKYAWRFWIPADPTVSEYRPALKRKSRT